MNIHQMQCVYQPLEDRLLLRVLAVDRSEFRFWLTRRYVKLLWQVILKLLERDPAAVALADEDTRRAVLGFQHDNAVRSGQFGRPFEEGAATLPLGAAPLLLSRIGGRPGEGGRQILSMHPEQGQGIDLGVDSRLLHLPSKLVADAVVQADWDMQLPMAQTFTG
ncbi:MAG TPA: hypothetical protein VGN52_25405, partial [Burkholderiales bacterium]